MLNSDKLLMIYETHCDTVAEPEEARKMKTVCEILRKQAAKNGNTLSGVSFVWQKDIGLDDATFWTFVEDFKSQIHYKITPEGFKVTFM